ncbi:MAG: hypothetical protein V4558_08665 [Gemmatimonadota bacterium]
MRRESLAALAFVALVGCGGGKPALSPADSLAALKSDSAMAAGAARRKAATNAQAAKMSKLAIDTVAAAGGRPLLRETYSYEGAARDPFRSVLATAQRGPELPDLKLTAIMYDTRDPGNSVAIFRDIGSNRRYDVHPGQRLGRIYVASVTRKDVTLRLDDFGTVREQTYSLRKAEDETP